VSNAQFKDKSIPVAKRSRQEALATAFYPQHASPEDRREVEAILRSEGWKGSGKGLLPDTTRGATSPLGGAMSVPKGRFTIRRTR